MRNENTYKNLLNELMIDCKKCCGLCCAALYFAKLEGFPTDKQAGEPCMNLMTDFRCTIHSKLSDCKMKGCLAYDCFGAGQKVTQRTYSGMNWMSTPEIKEQMFQVFLVTYQLHQMLWYLIEASTFIETDKLKEEIDLLILENEQMTGLNPEKILNIDIDKYKCKVNIILKKTIELVCLAKNKTTNHNKSFDFIGKNFRKTNLDYKNFSMSLLIAANLEGCSLYKTNFLGADLRDANIENTDLSHSVFLTQGQINSAKGNHNTKLPALFTYPTAWENK